VILFLILQLNLAFTPGVVNSSLSQQQICTTKWGLDHRHVTEEMKRIVANNYNIKRSAVKAKGKGPCCEFDHLIPRELGGADDIKNLWPQPWTDAQKKDKLENQLHKSVCSGRMTLKEARWKMVNWNSK
jgi:hypothetical protein